MNDKQNPCFQCTRRYPGCSADCADYKAWRKKRDELMQKIREEKYRDAKLTHFAVDSRRKSKRRH